MTTLLEIGRSHTCGALRPENVGAEVILMGWVGAWRDLGGRRFIDLRDRYGVIEPLLKGRRSHAVVPGEKEAVLQGREHQHYKEGAALSTTCTTLRTTVGRAQDDGLVEAVREQRFPRVGGGLRAD